MFKKIIIISILLFIFLVPIFSLSARGCVQTEGTVVLQVPIPGIPLRYNHTCDNYEFEGDGNGNLLIPYIQYFYKFFVGIAGIIAVFMIMYGGVQWLFSGGNPANITSAKETIFGAVAGLFLALGSYVLLIQINPQLVKFDFSIIPIETVSGCYDKQGNLNPSDKIPCGQVCGDDKGNKVFGECPFCESAGSVDTGACGNSKLGNKKSVYFDNCWYASCYFQGIIDVSKHKAFGEACVYIENNKNEYLPIEIAKDPDKLLNYPPTCADNLSLTFMKDDVLTVENFSFSDMYNEFASIDYQCCGDIFYVAGAWYSSEDSAICNSCPGQQQCILDASDYTLEVNTDSMLSGWVKVGEMEHQCLD